MELFGEWIPWTSHGTKQMENLMIYFPGLFHFDHTGKSMDIWRFPKMGVPPGIIHFNGVFPYEPCILGIPPLLEAPIYGIVPQ